MKLIQTFMMALVNAGVKKPETMPGCEYMTSIFDDIENATFEVIYRSKRKVVFKHFPSNLVYFFELNEFENGFKNVCLYLQEEKKDIFITNSIRADDMETHKSLMIGFDRIIKMIRNYDELVTACEDGVSEFYMLLAGCMRSSKNIVMTGKDKFSILNEIDGNFQKVSKNNLEIKTNIISSMENESFFAY